MSRFFFLRRWKAVALLAVVAGAAVLGAIVTITPPLASAQDADRICAINRDGPAQPPSRDQLGKLQVWDEPCALPAIAWQDGDGKARSLGDYEGKLVVLNLWATWCTPCVREMPALDRLQADMGGETFQVLAISQDREGAGTVRAWLDEAGIRNLGVHVDPKGTVGRALKAPGLPVTIIIDPQGREIARLMGEAEWDSPSMQKTLRGLMQSKPA